MSERYAVLVGNSSFPREPKLPALHYPENDVDALHEALTSAEHGIFTQAFALKNQPSPDVRERVNDVLSLAGRDDLVLIYYAGHGKLNRRGKLHLATADTRLATLEATSFAVTDLREYIDVSHSRRIVVILDCCYSGAAGDVFLRGTADDSLQQFASGRGIHLLTASTGIEPAVEVAGDGHGIFTKHLVAGIRGAGDLDGDGLVGVDELYRYVHGRVRAEGAQEPTMLNLDKVGELILARTGKEPRRERNRQIRADLYRLAAEGMVGDQLVAQAGALLDLPLDRLVERQREQLRLLDRWLAKELRVVELVESWTRLALASEVGGPTTAPAPGQEQAGASPPRSPASEPAAPLAPPAPSPSSAGEETLPDPPPRAPEGPRPRWARWRQATSRALASGFDGRLALGLLLAAVFAVNFVETSAETALARVSPSVAGFATELGGHFALASQKLEEDLGLAGGLNFLRHDRAPRVTAWIYSGSYFFVFPLLCLAVAVALARREGVRPFRVYSLALAADYALSLPFFLVLPIPERWAYPDSGAILLSDLVDSSLIDRLRPISGLDNCFPSFHTSMTVIAILVCFRFRSRLRWAALGLGATVVLSTLVLGIHWAADLVAGGAVAALSVAIGVYFDARLAARRRRRPRPAEEPAPVKLAAAV